MTGPRHFYLDANAWINVFSDAELYKVLLSSYRLKALSVTFSFELQRELITNPNVSLNISTCNAEKLEPFQFIVEPDSVFIFDHSVLDQAKLGTDASNLVFDFHSQGKIERVSDAVHLANAIDNECVLVTCDKQLIKSAKLLGNGINQICIDALRILLGLEPAHLCACES